MSKHGIQASNAVMENEGLRGYSDRRLSHRVRIGSIAFHALRLRCSEDPQVLAYIRALKGGDDIAHELETFLSGQRRSRKAFPTHLLDSLPTPRLVELVSEADEALSQLLDRYVATADSEHLQAVHHLARKHLARMNIATAGTQDLQEIGALVAYRLARYRRSYSPAIDGFGRPAYRNPFLGFLSATTRHAVAEWLNQDQGREARRIAILRPSVQAVQEQKARLEMMKRYCPSRVVARQALRLRRALKEMVRAYRELGLTRSQVEALFDNPLCAQEVQVSAEVTHKVADDTMSSPDTCIDRIDRALRVATVTQYLTPSYAEVVNRWGDEMNGVVAHASDEGVDLTPVSGNDRVLHHRARKSTIELLGDALVDPSAPAPLAQVARDVQDTELDLVVPSMKKRTWRRRS